MEKVKDVGRKELESIIRFHEDGLAQYRPYMAPSAQHIIERTVAALKRLLDTPPDR